MNKKHIILLALPSVIAILSSESMNVLMFNYSPINNSMKLLIGWQFLQALIGFLFGYISDKHYRKQALIISQVIGVSIGFILYFFQLKLWVIFLIACFNPMPVARAALLDNFPKVSSLRTLGFTFLIQYIPWALFGFLSNFPYQYIILIILTFLGFNILFTIFLFKDHYDVQNNNVKKRSYAKIVLLILTAFILAEICFYIDWDFLEFHPKYSKWFTPTTIATLLGVSIAMLYSRLPHIAVITVCYLLDSATILIAIFLCFNSYLECSLSIVSSMSHIAVIGGLYLPFVADAIIFHLGSKHRATGAALIEFAEAIAAFIGWFFIYMGNNFQMLLLGLIFLLFLIAAFLQKKCENKSLFIRKTKYSG